jgi:hypothetical protein
MTTSTTGSGGGAHRAPGQTPQPTGGNGAAPAGRHAAPDTGPQNAQQLSKRDAGLVAFIENLRNAEATAVEQQRRFQGLARQAAEEQPAHPSVADGLGTMAEMYGAAAKVASGIYPAARQRHRDDYERGENPRKGRTQVEQRADARQTYRDGAA